MNATKPPGVATATPIATHSAQAAVSPALTPAAVRDGVAIGLTFTQGAMTLSFQRVEGGAT